MSECTALEELDRFEPTSILAVPKSASWTCHLSLSRMFAGLMSLCTMFCDRRYANAFNSYAPKYCDNCILSGALHRRNDDMSPLRAKS